MNNKNVVLHIGAMKTASTALFTFLRAIAAELSSCSIWLDEKSHWLGENIVKNLPIEEGELKRLRNYYLDLYNNKPENTFIISQEDFARCGKLIARDLDRVRLPKQVFDARLML